MLTILHAADLHLDSPFRSLPPREAAQRRREQRELLNSLLDIALERRVDLCLLAGDLFDDAQVYPETLEALHKTLSALPCPVCIAPGNHDPWGEKSPYRAQIWPPNVHIFSSPAVTALPLPALGVTVYGCAFTSPARDDDPLAGFHAPDDGTVPVGVFHGDVDKPGHYAPIASESLAGSGLRYAALGHVHTGTRFLTAGPTVWAYPGCPQGRGFDETGDKGALLVHISDTNVTGEFLPLPGPRYWSVSLSVTGADPVTLLPEALGDRFQNDYLRLTLIGEAEPPDLPRLRAAAEPLCRVLELRDATSVPRDLWARAGEDTLTGLFLQEMRARLDAASEDQKARLRQAVRMGLAALEGRESW